MERIQAVTELIRSDVEGFREDWLQCRKEDQEKSIREDKRRLAQAKKRLADIDVLMTHIYEDMALGSLSRERYQKMAKGYEAEQASLNNEIIGLEDWIGTREEMGNSFDQFAALVEKYVDIPELTPTIVNEFVKKIIVYAPEKQGTKRVQKVKIIFNFLDELDMPMIGEPIVTESTCGRRGRRDLSITPPSAVIVPYYLLPSGFKAFSPFGADWERNSGGNFVSFMCFAW